MTGAPFSSASVSTSMRFLRAASGSVSTPAMRSGSSQILAGARSAVYSAASSPEPIQTIWWPSECPLLTPSQQPGPRPLTPAGGRPGRRQPRVLARADPDDLVALRVPAPHLDPDPGHDLPVSLEQLAPPVLHALLHGRHRLAPTVALGHLLRLLQGGALHEDAGAREARGLERPADVVGVEVREHYVRHVLRAVAGLLQVVHEVLFASELVSADESLG